MVAVCPSSGKNFMKDSVATHEWPGLLITSLLFSTEYPGNMSSIHRPRPLVARMGLQLGSCACMTGSRYCLSLAGIIAISCRDERVRSTDPIAICSRHRGQVLIAVVPVVFTITGPAELHDKSIMGVD